MDDFHAFFSFCNKIFTVFGFNYTKQFVSNGQTSYKICVIKLLYSCFLVILWVYLGYLNTLHIFSSEMDELTRIFGLFTNVSELFASLAIILTSICNCKKYCNILRSFSVNFLDHSDYKVLKQKFVIHFAGLLITIVCTYILTVAAFWDQRFTASFQAVVYCFVWLFFSVCSSVINCQYFVFSKWLAIHFQKLNGKLKNLALNEDRKGINGVEQFKFEEKKLFVSSEFKKFLNFNDKNMRRIQISELRKIHHEVFKICQLVNEYFSTVIVISLAENFFLTLLYIYCGVRLIIEYFQYFWWIKFLAFGIFLWALFHFGFVIYLINCGEGVHSEVDKTKSIVNEMLNTEGDSEIKEELVIFAAQTRNEMFRFSPHGFFYLGHKLLFSMISSGVAYLVILIQFYVAFYNEQKEKNLIHEGNWSTVEKNNRN